jgi:hypothetical protein
VSFLNPSGKYLENYLEGKLNLPVGDRERVDLPCASHWRSILGKKS